MYKETKEIAFIISWTQSSHDVFNLCGIWGKLVRTFFSQQLNMIWSEEIQTQMWHRILPLGGTFNQLMCFCSFCMICSLMKVRNCKSRKSESDGLLFGFGRNHCWSYRQYMSQHTWYNLTTLRRAGSQEMLWLSGRHVQPCVMSTICFGWRSQRRGWCAHKHCNPKLLYRNMSAGIFFVNHQNDIYLCIKHIDIHRSTFKITESRKLYDITFKIYTQNHATKRLKCTKAMFSYISALLLKCSGSGESETPAPPWLYTGPV